MKINKIRTAQSGRSMIEMLGVLAIIGILSVGGIYGYTLAMRKHQANEIVKISSMLMVSAMSSNEGSAKMSKIFSSTQKPKDVQDIVACAVVEGAATVSIQFKSGTTNTDAICDLIGSTVVNSGYAIDYCPASADDMDCD